MWLILPIVYCKSRVYSKVTVLTIMKMYNIKCFKYIDVDKKNRAFQNPYTFFSFFFSSLVDGIHNGPNDSTALGSHCNHINNMREKITFPLLKVKKLFFFNVLIWLIWSQSYLDACLCFVIFLHNVGTQVCMNCFSKDIGTTKLSKENRQSYGNFDNMKKKKIEKKIMLLFYSW